MLDVYEILKNLEYRAVGIDPTKPDEMKEGFFCAFRTIGLPIRNADFANAKEIIVPIDAPISDVNDPIKKSETPQQDVTDGVPVQQNPIPEKSRLNLHWLTNPQLKLNPIFQVEPSTVGISQTWEAIINAATLNYKPSDADPELKKAYDDLKALLKKIKPEYEEGEKNYNQALDDLITLFTNCKSNGEAGKLEWQLKGKRASDKVNEAFAEWGEIKGEFDRIVAILNSKGQDPASFFISKSKTNYNNWRIPLAGTNSNIPFTEILPTDWYNPAATGWTKFDSSKLTSSTVVRNSKVEASGRTGFSVGFWSVGANASYSSDKKDTQINVNNLEITFEYTIADIKREWLDTSLFNAKNWYLKSEDAKGNPYKKNCISNGTFGQNYQDQNKNIFLPTIPTSLILVKNLKISWKSDTNHISSLNETISGGGSVGWGLFNLGGSYGRTKEEADTFSETNTESLTVNGVQLIGYVCEILPASPYLDSK